MIPMGTTPDPEAENNAAAWAALEAADGANVQVNRPFSGSYIPATGESQHRAKSDGTGVTFQTTAPAVSGLSSMANPGTRITLRGGSETTLGSAHAAGLVALTPTGWEEVAPTMIAPTPTQGGPQDASTALPMMTLAETQVVDTLTNTTDQMSLTGVLEATLRGRRPNPVDLGRLASSLQIEPSAAENMVADAMDAFTRQAAQAVARAGVTDFEHFSGWANKYAPNELMRTMREQVAGRATNGYAALAKEYLMDLPRVAPQMVLSTAAQVGIQATQDKHGTIIVTIPGTGQFAWRDAVRLGLIKVSN
jgi:hypothetical protein